MTSLAGAAAAAAAEKPGGRQQNMGGGARAEGQDHAEGGASGENAGRKECPPFVFLGGTCSTSTWRQDIAIPFLERKQVHYYNPQRPAWTEDMVTIEANAKDAATVCLMHITGQSRGIAVSG